MCKLSVMMSLLIICLLSFSPVARYHLLRQVQMHDQPTQEAFQACVDPGLETPQQEGQGRGCQPQEVSSCRQGPACHRRCLHRGDQEEKTDPQGPQCRH